MIGVIDIGTNTIRAVGYSDKLSVLCENVYESQILNYTDENKKLSFLGISSLCETIEKHIKFFKQNNISKIYAFATSAMRDIKNFDEVYSYIKEKTGVEIELLSEKDEAKCDYYAINNAVLENGIKVGIDLGGGSCQIVVFDNDVKYFNSFPIGVKRLYNKFGKYNSQTEILTYIKEILKEAPRYESKTLYVMGGTGKIIAKILKTKEIDVNSFNINSFPSEESYKEFIMSINSVPYGVLVISEIAKHCGAESVKIMNCSSRDGYVISKLYG